MNIIHILRVKAQRSAARAAMAGRRAARKLRRDGRGAVAVEYGFLLALVVLAVLFSIRELGRANLDVWSNVATKVQAAGQ